MNPRSSHDDQLVSLPREGRAAAWRLFVAVPLPEAVREVVRNLTTELAAEEWPVRWVTAEGAHLTLHFLGETAPERAELVRLALPPVVARHAAFELRTAGLGVFPNLRRPRVIWLGLHGQGHRLQALHDDLAATLQGLGFAVDARPLQPHITLGRVRNTGVPGFALRDLPDALRPHLADVGTRPAPVARAVPIHEVQLIRSHLGRDGARYEPLGQYALAATNASPRRGAR